MVPLPLNAVRAAAADTAGSAVAAPVADTAADATADGRAALAGATTDTAFVATAADLAGDLYRRACHTRRHCGFHVPRSARSSRHF